MRLLAGGSEKVAGGLRWQTGTGRFALALG
jgi:hypothetical protein